MAGVGMGDNPTTDLKDEARHIAEVLEIAVPDQATTDELQQWVLWWRESYEAARGLPEKQRLYLQSGGWWPPVTAAQLANSAPDIVRRTRRPGLSHRSSIIK
jgi:hypothetical protein